MRGSITATNLLRAIAAVVKKDAPVKIYDKSMFIVITDGHMSCSFLSLP